MSSVTDPHHVDADADQDQDTACHFEPDLEPACHFDADADPDHTCIIYLRRHHI